MNRPIALSLTLLAAALAATLLVGCGGASASGPLTMEDSGSKRTMAVGDTLVIELESNRTTGYTWGVDGSVPPQLKQMGEPVYTGQNEGPSTVGAGGTETWTFQAVSAGSGTLRLKYWRPFEPDEQPAETFEVDVEVE